MNFDKLMKTMKHKDEVTKERDDMTFERNQKMQAQLKQSLEEKDLKLLDALIDAV